MNAGSAKSGKWVKLTLLLLSIMTILAAAMVAPCIPDIAKAFPETANIELKSKLLLSIPPLFIAISAPFVGRIIDSYGRLGVLYFGLFLYATAGSAGYILIDMTQLLVSRALLGIAIGCIMTVTITLIGDYFEGDERKRFIGYQSAFIGFSGVAFLVIGGLLAGISWRVPFLVYLIPVGIIPFVIRYIKEPQHVGADTSESVNPFKGILPILFVTGFIIMVLLYIVPTQLPFYLIENGINSPEQSGFTLSLHALGVVVLSLSYSRLKSLFSFQHVYFIAFVVMGMGYILTAVSDSFLLILSAMFLSGGGFGLLISNTNFWVIEVTKTRNRGRVMGILTTFLFMGQFLSPLIAEPILNQSGIDMLFHYSGIFMLLIGSLFLLKSRAMKTADA